VTTGTDYDSIGTTYASTRRADPRVEARLHAALGDARSVVNVGAGTGSYEPRDRMVIAVEPSRTMLSQRPPDAAPAVRAQAEALPFPRRAFDVALAVLTVHHWHDLAAGLAELRRVAPRQVLLTFEPAVSDATWIVADYFPAMLDTESERSAPSVAHVAAHLGVDRVEVVPVPSDCVDGFAGSFWNRPEAYLRDDVQAGISGFAQMDPARRQRATERLRAELQSGEWDAKYGALRSRHECDLGYRMIVAGELNRHG
jgi:SAM-dependent methyltransferase